MDPFWGNLFHRHQEAEGALFELVVQVPLFQDLSRREFRRLEGLLHRRTLTAGEAIVREGEKGVGMYILLSGEVQVVQQGEDGVQQELARLGPGDFFGEQALLDETPRTASAMAMGPCRVVGFFRPDLLGLIESDPRLGLKVVLGLSQMIAVRLRHTNRLLKETRLQVRKAEMEKVHLEKELTRCRGEETALEQTIGEVEGERRQTAEGRRS